MLTLDDLKTLVICAVCGAVYAEQALCPVCMHAADEGDPADGPEPDASGEATP